MGRADFLKPRLVPSAVKAHLRAGVVRHDALGLLAPFDDVAAWRAQGAKVPDTAVS